MAGGTLSRMSGGKLIRMSGGTLSWMDGGELSSMDGGTLSRMDGGELSRMEGWAVVQSYNSIDPQVIHGQNAVLIDRRTSPPKINVGGVEYVAKKSRAKK